MQDIKTIRLVNGGQAIVEARDYERLNKYRWFQDGQGYAHRQGWTDGKHWCVFMHRVVNGTPDNLFTDHINGNKLDNRRENLRTCNKAQNSANRPKIGAKILTSKYKGVSFHPSTGLWRARVRDGSFERTTYHKTDLQAAADYNRMAVERFGQFASLNELPDGIIPTVHREKSSRFRGVSFLKESNNWRCHIDIDGKTTCIGTYATELEAAKAYNETATRIRGYKAKLNDLNE